MNAMDAELPGGLCIRGDIIDEDGAVRIDGEAVDQQRINSWIRFDHPDLAGNDATLKPRKELKAFERRGVSLGRIIAQETKRNCPSAQLLEDCHAARDWAGDHFVEAGMVGVDEVG